MGFVVVVYLCAGFLVVMVVLSVRTTRSISTNAQVAALTPIYRQGVCLSSELHRLVPAGTSVYVTPNADGYVTQLLTQYVTLWARPTPTPHRAQWTVALAFGPGGCGGEHIVATRVR